MKTKTLDVNEQASRQLSIEETVGSTMRQLEHKQRSESTKRGIKAAKVRREQESK